MSNRFTERAQRVILIAQEEAKREQGNKADALRSLGARQHQAHAAG